MQTRQFLKRLMFLCSQHYDFYPFTALESRLPNAAKPYLVDFRQFMEVYVGVSLSSAVITQLEM